MSGEFRERFRSLTILFCLSIAVAGLLHLHYVLMWYERDFYRTNYPAVHDSWPNNGSFSVIGVYSAEWDNIPNHLARVREAGEHWLPNDPQIKGGTTLRLLLTDFAFYSSLGLVFRALGDIHWTFYVSRFALCMLWVVVLYLTLRQAGRNRRSARFFAVTLTLFMDIVISVYPNNPLMAAKDVLRRAFWIFGNEMYWFGPVRMVHPIFPYPMFLLAGLWIVKSAVGTARPWVTVLAAAFWGAVVTYSHADVFLVFYGAVPIFLGLRRLFGYGWDRRVLAAYVMALVLSLPFILTWPSFEEWHKILNILPGRKFAVHSILYACLAFAACRWHRDNPAMLWFGACLWTVFALCNMQVITGKTVDPYHYNWIGNFVSAIFLCAVLAKKIQEKQHLLRCGLALVMLVAASRMISYSAQHYRNYSIPKDIEAGLSWLNEHTPPESVVGGLSFEVACLVPTYSHNKTMAAKLSPQTSMISHEENARRLRYVGEILAVPSSTMIPVLTERMPYKDIMAAMSGDAQAVRDMREERSGVDHFLAGRNYEHIRKSVARAFADTDARPYELDYVWVGPVERRRAPQNFLEVSPYRLEPVYSNATVTLYKFLGPKSR